MGYLEYGVDRKERVPLLPTFFLNNNSADGNDVSAKTQAGIPLAVDAGPGWERAWGR